MYLLYFVHTLIKCNESHPHTHRQRHGHRHTHTRAHKHSDLVEQLSRAVPLLRFNYRLGPGLVRRVSLSTVCSATFRHEYETEQCQWQKLARATKYPCSSRWPATGIFACRRRSAARQSFSLNFPE